MNDPFTDNKEKGGELSTSFIENTENENETETDNKEKLNDPFTENKENKDENGIRGMDPCLAFTVQARSNRNSMSCQTLNHSDNSLAKNCNGSHSTHSLMYSYPGNSESNQEPSIPISESTQSCDMFLNLTPPPRIEDFTRSLSSSSSLQEDQLKASSSRQEAVNKLFSNSNPSGGSNRSNKHSNYGKSQQKFLARLHAQKDSLNPFAALRFPSPPETISPHIDLQYSLSQSHSIGSGNATEDILNGLPSLNINNLPSTLEEMNINRPEEECKPTSSRQPLNKPVLIPKENEDNPFKESFDQLDNPFGVSEKRPTSERGSNISSVEDDSISEIVPSDQDDTVVVLDPAEQESTQSAEPKSLSSPSRKAKDPAIPKRRSLLSYFRRNSIIEMKTPEDKRQVAERIGVSLPQMEKQNTTTETSTETTKETTKETSTETTTETTKDPVKTVDLVEFFDNDDEFVVGEDGQRLRVLFDNMLPMVGNNPIIPEPEEMEEQVSCKAEALLTMLASMNLGWRKGAKKKLLEKRIHDILKEKRPGDIDKDLRVCQK